MPAIDLTPIPHYLRQDPEAEHSSLPIVTAPQELPINHLTWENFERLIFRLVRLEAEVTDCRLFGTAGQDQKGIDLYARLEVGGGSDEIHVYQCKRVQRVQPSDLRDWVSTFLQHTSGTFLKSKSKRPKKFVICTSASLKPTKLLEELERQRERLREAGHELGVLDREEITERLRADPTLVGDFFGEAWSRAFFPSERNSGRSSCTLRLGGFCAELFAELRVIPKSRYQPATATSVDIDKVFVLADTMDRIATNYLRDGTEVRILPNRIPEFSDQFDFDAGWYLLPMPVIEAVSHYDRTILFGAPGSGKSTALRFLATCLAGEIAWPEREWSQKLRSVHWKHSLFLPLFIFAPNVMAYLQQPGKQKKELVNYFVSEYDTLSPVLSDVYELLHSGRVLVILDGLGELSDDDMNLVLEKTRNFERQYPDCRFVVASSSERENAAINATVAQAQHIRLAPLTQHQILSHIEIWREDSQLERNASLQVKDSIMSTELRRLAESPLMLAEMLAIVDDIGRPPNDQMELLEELKARIVRAVSTNRDCDESSLEKTISELAMSARLSGIERIGLKDVLGAVATTSATKEMASFIWAEPMLFVDVGEGEKKFRDPLITDIFCGVRLASQTNFISSSADLLTNDPVVWGRPFFIAASYANVDAAFAAANAVLAKLEIRSTEKSKTALSAVGDALTHFSNRTTCERPERQDVARKFNRLVLEQLSKLDLFQDDRAKFGRLLSIVGDERPGVCSMPEFVVVEKGPSRVGMRGSSGVFDIPYDFWCSKYPVTNAQYERWLSEDSTARVPDVPTWDLVSRRISREFRNHPVVSVSFEDAIRYCQWLTKTLKTVPDGFAVRLPTDAEWQKMFRGGLKLPDGYANPEPERVFPWGNEWIEGSANLPENRERLLRPTAVGVYPKDVSPYGVHDLCGNVLEWTSTSWGGKNPDKPEFGEPYDPQDGREDPTDTGLRILRGGSFLFSEGEANCACRLDPKQRFDDTGFRVIIGPSDVAATYS